MTPLHVAMMARAVANNGKMMKTYLVEMVTTDNGTVIGQTRPSVLYECIGAACSDYIEAVSYTHLDVYKRKVLSTVRMLP